jgi:MFS family permease
MGSDPQGLTPFAEGVSLQGRTSEPGWGALLAPQWALQLTVLLGGVLLHSMNVLLTATVLPSIVIGVGGADLMSWPTTAFLASSIVAATGTGALTVAVGSRSAFCVGAAIYCTGSLMCALATSMPLVIAGRFVQGFGGGLLSALAYVLVRYLFPAELWARVFGLIAAVWGVSVLVGPLVGGIFASYGFWRGAFLAVAALAALLSILAPRILPAAAAGGRTPVGQLPVLRVVLVCSAIAALSMATIASGLASKVVLIAAAIVGMIQALRIDRASAAPLLPREAFSLRSPAGAGLWMVLLLSMATSPLPIFGPLFLQRLYGLDPLTAGYMVAGSSLAWTLAALAVASLSEGWATRLAVAGPLVMGVGLLGVGALMPSGPVAALLAPIALIGGGIGACWAFIAQRIMGGASHGEEDIAAASVATVQQAGLAFGAAAAGLIANASGLSDALDPAAIARAAFWVHASFVIATLAASVVGGRLSTTARATARNAP